MTPSLRDLKVAAALLTVWLLWGSSFLSIRVVVLSSPPLLAAGVRFVAAGLLLLVGLVAWRRWHGGGPVRADLAAHVGAWCLLGLLNFLAANGLISIAAQEMPSSTVAVLYATVPLWTLVLAAAAARRPPSARDLGRTGLGVLGVGVVLGLDTDTSRVPALLVLVAAASWASATLLAARPRPASEPSAERPSAALACSVQMLAGGVGLLVLSVLAGEPAAFNPAAVTGQAWLAEAHLILFGSLAGFSAYTWLLVSEVDPRLTGTFAYVCPVVAVILGAWVLDEPLAVNTLAGTALVALSVALTVRATPPARATSGRVERSAGPYAEELARRGR